MLIKNMSYEVLQAVIKNDNYIEFLPQEVKEVEDEIGLRFLERYPIENNPKCYMVRVEQEEPKFKEVVEDAPIEKEGTDFTCAVCGFIAGSKAGLKSHSRKHK